ncbi:hypothetical protein VaNZ11_010048 [Volvox africanus]|uniref:Globin n=1 Tax=Volvox africanus TaxID=51714 RepID=A0ABQ5S8Q6_9CHLO|nr:hypothetical protein VaNZ11_010048 [Volvox africanus]
MGNGCSHFIDFWAHMATEADIQKAARSIETWQKAQDANRGGGGGLQQHTGAVSYRLGGQDVVKRVIEGFYKRLYANERLRVFLHDQDVITLKAKQSAFMSWLFGQPSQSFAGKNLRIAHLRLIKQRGFSPADFETGLSLFTDAMREQGSPEAIVSEVLMKMRPFKEIIFTPSACDAEEEARWIVEERVEQQQQQKQIEATATGTIEAVATTPTDAAAAIETGRSGNSRPGSVRSSQCPFTGGRLSRPPSGGSSGGVNAMERCMGEKSGVGMGDSQAKPPSTPPAPPPHGTAAPASRPESAAPCRTGTRPESAAAAAATTAAGTDTAGVTAAAAVTATAASSVGNAPAAAASVAAAATESFPPPPPLASPPRANSRPASRSVSIPGVATAAAATAAAVGIPDVVRPVSRRSAPGSQPQSAVPVIPSSPPSPSPSRAVIPPLPALTSAERDTALPPTAAGEGDRLESDKGVPELAPASSAAATTTAAAVAAPAPAPAPAPTLATPPRADDANVAAEDIVDAFMTEVFAEEPGAVVDEALAEMGTVRQSNPADGSVSGGGNAKDSTLQPTTAAAAAAAVAGNGTAAAVAATAPSRTATPLAGSQRLDAAQVVATTPLLAPPAAARIATPLVERQRPGSVAGAAAPSPPPPLEMTRGSTPPPLVGNPRPSVASAVAAAAAPPTPPSAPSGTPLPLPPLPSGTAAPSPPPPQPLAPARIGTPLVGVQRVDPGSGMAPVPAPAAAPAAAPPVSTAAADVPAAASKPRVGGIALLGRRPEGGPAAAVAAVAVAVAAAPPPKPPPPARISGPGGPPPHPGVRHKPRKVGKAF